MDVLKTSSQALRLYQEKLNILSHNLANVSTDGYKKIYSSFVEDGNSFRLDNYVDKSKGVFINTSRDLDFAIEGDGFLKVQDENGNLFYSKNLSFYVDENGYLKNSFGFYVLNESGKIKIENFGSFSIDENGYIYDGEKKGDRIGLVSFEKGANLIYFGNGCYKIDGNLKDYNGKILKGYKEGSNVNSIEEMSDMIMVMRNFERISNLINQENAATSKMISSLSKF